MPKKYQKIISRISPELRQLIFTLNLLPQELDQFERDLTELGLALSQALLTAPNNAETLEIVYREKLQSLVSPLLATALEKSKGFLNKRFALGRLINEKRLLVTAVEAYRQSSQVGLDATFAFDKPISAFSFNADSTLQITSFRVLELLTKTPLNRLIICPVCRLVAFTRKTNARTCGERVCVDGLQNLIKKQAKQKGRQAFLAHEQENYESL